MRKRLALNAGRVICGVDPARADNRKWNARSRQIGRRPTPMNSRQEECAGTRIESCEAVLREGSDRRPWGHSWDAEFDGNDIRIDYKARSLGRRIRFRDSREFATEDPWPTRKKR